MLSESVFAVAIAAFLDTFILTGYITSGAAIFVAAAALSYLGVSEWEIAIFSLLGVVFGEAVNFLVSKLPQAQQRFDSALVTASRSRYGLVRLLAIVTHRATDRWHITLLKLLLFRFVAVLRPVNFGLRALARRLSFIDWALMVIASAVWVSFWVLVLDHVMPLFDSF